MRALKISEGMVHELANSRKRYWRMGQMLSVALTNKVIACLGYISVTDYYFLPFRIDTEDDIGS